MSFNVNKKKKQSDKDIEISQINLRDQRNRKVVLPKLDQTKLSKIDNVTTMIAGEKVNKKCNKITNIIASADPRDVLCRVVKKTNQKGLSKIDCVTALVSGKDQCSNCVVTKADPRDVLCRVVDGIDQTGLTELDDINSLTLAVNEDGECVVVKTDPRDVLCRVIEGVDQPGLSELDDINSLTVALNDDGECVVVKADPRDVLCRVVERTNQLGLFELDDINSLTVALNADEECVVIKADPRDVLCRVIEGVDQTGLSEFDEIKSLIVGLNADEECEVVKADPRDVLCRVVERTNQLGLFELDDINSLTVALNADEECVVIKADPRDVLCRVIEGVDQTGLSEFDEIKSLIVGLNADEECEVVKADPRDVLCRVVEGVDQTGLAELDEINSLTVALNADEECVVVKADPRDVLCRVVEGVDQTGLAELDEINSLTMALNDDGNCVLVKATVDDILCNKFDNDDCETLYDLTEGNTGNTGSIKLVSTFKDQNGNCQLKSHGLDENHLVVGGPNNTYISLEPPTTSSVLTSTSPTFTPYWNSFFIPTKITKIIRFRPDLRVVPSDQFFLLCYVTWYKFGDMNVLNFSNSSSMQKSGSFLAACGIYYTGHGGFNNLVSEEDMRLIFPGMIIPQKIEFNNNSHFPKYPDAPYPDINRFPPSSISNHFYDGTSGGFPAVEWSSNTGPFLGNERNFFYPRFTASVTATERAIGTPVTTASLRTLVTTTQLDPLFRRTTGVAIFALDQYVIPGIPVANDPNGHIQIYRTTVPQELEGFLNLWRVGFDPRFDNFSFTWINYNIADATDSISNTPPEVGIVNPCT